jgi:uncharacterized alkaline shock family protein YloU
VTEPLALSGPEGSISVSPAALVQLVVTAAESVEGAQVKRPKRTVEVEHGDGLATVSLALSAAQGVPLADLAREVQERVAAALAATCRLDVQGVDVLVETVV